MIQRVGDQVLPVSKHFMYVAYEKCKDELVKARKTAAIASDNPAMKGWPFELEQLHIVIDETASGGAVSDKERNLVLRVGKDAVAVYDGKTLDKKIGEYTDFVIKCSKWNQGCSQSENLRELQVQEGRGLPS